MNTINGNYMYLLQHRVQEQPTPYTCLYKKGQLRLFKALDLGFFKTSSRSTSYTFESNTYKGVEHSYLSPEKRENSSMM